MKPIVLSLAAALLWIGAGTGRAQTLTLLGSADFTVEAGATTAGYTQTSTSLSFSGTQSFGATLGGIFGTTMDWSAAPGFGLTMSVSGTNPNMLFAVEFYNAAFEIISKYNGSTVGATSTPTVLDLTFDSFGPGGGDFSDVKGMQFTWNTFDSINATLDNITAVPEPSTWVLLLSGLALLAGCHQFGRRKAAPR